MANVSFTLLVLKTRQIEPLRRFYQTLGIELTDEKHGNGPLHFAGKVGDVVIEIYPLLDDSAQVDSSTRLGFGVENLAEVIQVLQKLETKIVSPPKDTAWGFQAVVRDPDGRSVELRQENENGTQLRISP